MRGKFRDAVVAGLMDSKFWNPAIAGLTVFFAISYIAFVNPVILAGMGVPTGESFFGTCLIAGLGSIACGLWSRSPTAMAPGMAFNVFVVSYARQTNLPWQAILAICATAGLFLLVISAKGWRQKTITAIPVPLRLAVVGGIGATLTDNAIKLLRQTETAAPDGGRIAAFAGGLTVIVLGYIVLRSYAEQLRAADRPLVADAMDVLGRSSLLVSIFVAAFIAHHFHVVDANRITAIRPGFLLAGDPDLLSKAWNLSALPLLLVLVYMLIADIAGTPFQLLDQSIKDREMRVERSFIIDSLANIVGPLLCTSPIVYYAENNAAKIVGGESGAVAVWVGAGFFLLLGWGFFFGGAQLLPEIAVAPVLFCVGLLVIGAAIGRTESGVMDAETNPAWSEGERLPAAITIVLTPTIGLEYGLAAGLLAYFSYYLLAPTRQNGGPLDSRAPLAILFVLALIAVTVKLMVHS